MSQYLEPREKNWAVYILFALAVVAGILALIDAARYMGWLAFSASVPGLGEIKFVLPNAKWFAAILSAIVGIIWFVVAKWLWDLNPSGWLFVVVIAVFNLIMLLLALLGATTFNQILPALAVNAIALILALLPGTKDAFRVPSAQDTAAARAAVASAAATRAAAVQPAPAPKPEPVVAPAPKVEDLTKIEGIGPKISEALAERGITTYEELKAMSEDDLRQLLADAGLSADPSTWPEQARLADAGMWEALEALQDKLEGGREA